VVVTGDTLAMHIAIARGSARCRALRPDLAARDRGLRRGERLAARPRLPGLLQADCDFVPNCMESMPDADARATRRRCRQLEPVNDSSGRTVARPTTRPRTSRRSWTAIAGAGSRASRSGGRRQTRPTAPGRRGGMAARDPRVHPAARTTDRGRGPRRARGLRHGARARRRLRVRDGRGLQPRPHPPAGADQGARALRRRARAAGGARRRGHRAPAWRRALTPPATSTCASCWACRCRTATAATAAAAAAR
jgi:hypothetical protein